MDVHIDEVVASVRAVDSQAIVSPAMLHRIVSAVLEELDRRQTDEALRRTERVVGRGITDTGGGR